MEKLLRLVLESTGRGQIEKQTAAQILHLIKSEEWKADDDIAIIGIGADLPNVTDLSDFWDNLLNGVDFIGPLPESRRQDVDRYLDYSGLEDPDEIQYLEGAFLDDIDKFDYKLFRLSPKEASLMDPYQRLFLQTAWSAVEDAGYGGKKLAKTATGVFVGYASNAKDCYQKMILDVNPDDMALAGVGNVTAMLPSRISYLLDLKGPTMVLDTACSSAAVSVHSAVQALKNGDCEMALAGSVRMNLLPFEKEYLKFGLESSDGRTRTFDNTADGAGMGEAIIAVLLKPLKKAVKDRDHIYAVIKGTAINQDGASIGITAPNPDAQMDVILKAWQNAQINPETLAYIEAHGTGTTLGDPLELDGLTRAFRRHTDKQQITALGSVKTNLGHTFESAGLAGLLKCALVLQNRTIPPNINFNRPTHKFNFTDSPVYVSNSTRRWESEEPMRCGLSSFGFSGTNVHMVLEEAPALQREGVSQTSGQLFTLSARSEAALHAAVQNYADFLGGRGSALELGDICYTANTGRGHYEYRLALTVQSREELAELLTHMHTAGLHNAQDPRIHYGTHKVVPPNKEGRLPHEITEREKTEVSRTSAERIQTFRAGEGQDAALLNEVAALYARGAEVPWEQLYKSEPLRKVSLPVYPFERHRCWIDVPDGRKENTVQRAADKFFAIKWKQQRLTSPVVRTERGPVLILMDQKGLGEAMAVRYRESGRRVIEVGFGSEYQQLDDDRYTISGIEADYVRLVQDLQDVPFDKVLHLFTLTADAGVTRFSALNESQLRGVYSLFYFTRALAHAGIDREMDVVLLGENAVEVSGVETAVHPENVTLFGMGKVVLKEHGNMACRSIDVDELTALDDIWAELEAVTDVYQTAYRDGIRYVEEFAEIDTVQAADRPLTVREDGVYLITGGTGGIGLEVAKYLARQQRVNLVLINRTKMPERERWDEILREGTDRRNIQKIENIRDIEQLGAQVVCYSADVADREGIREVLDEVRAAYGRIDGIIHGAGVGGAEAIVKREMSDFHAVFNPKVLGTWNLDDLTRADNLDFMLLFSSIASLFSAPGQGDYIAANGYLDSYAAYRNKQGLRTVTINWSTWRETGMSVQHDFTVDTLFKAIMTREAIEGLHHVLNKDVPLALIGEVNYESKMIYLLDRFQFALSKKIRRELEKRIGKTKRPSGRKAKKEISAVKLVGKSNGDYSELEQRVGMIWAKVLGFEELNIYDNFYELGGDSILGLKIANLINDELHVQVGVADLLSFLTVADFVTYLEGMGLEAAAGGISLYSLLQPVQEGAYHPTSSAQKRLYVIDQLEGSSINYNLSKTIRITGPLDVARLERTFIKLVERHETLRTSFELRDGEPVQHIHPQVSFNIERYQAQEEEIKDLLTAFVRPFDLAQAPLLRIGVIDLQAEEHILTFDMHHIITDGVSIDILIQEFVELYEGRELGALKLQYKDYAVWQSRILAEGLLKPQEEYWLSVFAGEIPLLNLPTDYPRPAVKSIEGNTISFTLDEELRERIYRLTKASGTTLYMLLLAAYNVLLSKYAAQEDIIIGTPIIGRPHTDLEKIVGMFVNTLVLRNFPRGDQTFQAFLHEVRDNTLKAYENQDYQLEEFVSRLRLQRDRSRNPLFDVWFVLQNVGVSEIQIQDLEICSYDYENTTAKFDLMLEVFERENELTFNLNYCTKLYQLATAERMLGDYVELLDLISRDVEIKLHDIELLSIRNRLVADANDEELDDIQFNF